MKKIFPLLLLLLALPAMAQTFGEPLRFVYKLHGQTRRFDYIFNKTSGGGIKLDWTIERNLKLWHGSYTMPRLAVEKGTQMSLQQPDDGSHITLPENTTFAMVSRSALASMKKKNAVTQWDSKQWRTINKSGDTIEVQALDGTCMTVLNNPELPLILEMKNNTDEVNWSVTR